MPPLDSEKTANNIVEELNKVPGGLLEKAEEKLTSMEKSLENLEVKADTGIDESVLKSQPLENSLELFSSSGSRSDKIDHLSNKVIPSKDHEVLGSPQLFPSNEKPDTNMDVVSLSNRFKSAEKLPWSNSLGKFVPNDDITINNPNDIFFVGNGIKLPLNMVKKDDGALHLAVDLDKLCGCQNATCPQNKTAIEETVGSILEKEAELKNELEHSSHITGAIEDEVVGAISPSTNSAQETGLLEMKDNIAAGFGSKELQHENAEKLKRSAVDPEDLGFNPSTISNDFDPVIKGLPHAFPQQSKIINLDGVDFKEQKEQEILPISTVPTFTTPWKSLLTSAPSNAASKFFKDFWSKSFEDFRSHLPSVESFNPLSVPQQVFRGFANPLNDELEKEIKKLTTESPVVLQPTPTKPGEILDLSSRIAPDLPEFDIFKTTPTKPSRILDLSSGVAPNLPAFDTFKPLFIPQQVFRSFLPTVDERFEGKTEESTSTPDVVLQPVQSPEIPDLGSRIRSFFAERFNGNDEKFDRVTKVRGPYEFKGLGNQVAENLKAFDETVENYKRENEKVLKEGAQNLFATTKDTGKQEIGLVNNFMNWLKGVALRNEK